MGQSLIDVRTDSANIGVFAHRTDLVSPDDSSVFVLTQGQFKRNSSRQPAGLMRTVQLAGSVNRI